MRTRSRTQLQVMTARIATTGLLATSVVGVLTGMAAASPAPKYTICHGTNSESNPYVQITVNESAVDGFGKNDHTHHTGPIWKAGDKANGVVWGDIIPPTPGAPNGLNWDQKGQEILANGCKVVETPPEAVAPDMSIEKTGTASGQPGDAVSYTLSVQNVGTGPTTPTTTVTDNLPSGLADGTMAFTSGDGTWVCDAAASANPSCSTDDVLDVGDSAVFTVSSTIEGAEAFGELPTTVTDEGVVSTPGDTDETNDTDTFPTDVDAPDVPVTDPAVSFANACKTGISVTLTNMKVDDTTTDDVTFTVVSPSGKSKQVTVRADQIVRLAYKVKEDTTATVTVSAPGLTETSHSYKKNCTKVLGEKVVKTPKTPKPPAVQGEQQQLPFTGMPAGEAMIIAMLMLTVGGALSVLGRRRAGEESAS